MSRVLHDSQSKGPNPLVFSNPSRRTFLGMGIQNHYIQPREENVWNTCIQRAKVTLCVLIAPIKCSHELGQGGDEREWQESVLSELSSILVSLSACLRPGQWVGELVELNFLLSRWLNYKFIYHRQCPWMNMSQLVPNTATLVMASQVGVLSYTFYWHMALSGMLSFYSSQSALTASKCCHATDFTTWLGSWGWFGAEFGSHTQIF